MCDITWLSGALTQLASTASSPFRVQILSSSPRPCHLEVPNSVGLWELWQVLTWLLVSFKAAESRQESDLVVLSLAGSSGE